MRKSPPPSAERMHQRALSSNTSPSLGGTMVEPKSPADERASVAESTDARPPLSSRKRHKKLVRLLTVMAYVFSVSLGAIVLSLYYVFLWDPPEINRNGRKLHHPLLPRPERLTGAENGTWAATTQDTTGTAVSSTVSL